MANDRLNINWSKVFALPHVRNNKGEVDLDIAMNILREEAEEFLEQEITQEQMIEAINDVFSLLKETDPAKSSMKIDNLVQRAIELLKLPVNQDTTLAQKQLKDFIGSESKKFEESNGEEGLFLSKRGPGMGVHQTSPELVAAYRKLQGKKNSQ